MNGDAEPGGSLDAVNVGGADAARPGGGASDLVVPGDCVARNRGADFVKHLVPSPCAGTSIWPSDVKK
jgi:hypothetical protein